MLSFRTRGNFVDFVHTDNTSLEVESVIMSLHNTSKAVDWSLPEDTTRINFTIDDISYDNILITDIDFDGVTMTAQADFKTNIETIFPGLAGGGGGIETIVAGSGIAVDATDPANPEVSATGGGVYLVAPTVTLTDAQIKALPSTPVQIVAAQGAGKLIQPVFAIGIVDASAGAYVADANASLIFTIAGSYASVPSITQLQLQTVGKSIINFSFPHQEVAGPGSFASMSMPSFQFGAGNDNQPLVIDDSWAGVANYTGGNAANTLKIIVHYALIDI